MDKEPVVHIVHHIDTEGPLHEPVHELFERLEKTLGVDLEVFPSKESLELLRKGAFSNISSEHVKEINKLIDPHLIAFKESWTEIDEMLYRMLSKEYRNSFSDSFGGGWVYNWHIMDHVGFETNKRRRDFGFLNIFNHYSYILKKTESWNDQIHWHFHPIPFWKEAHIVATSYENSYPLIHQIISRRIIDKQWFPVVNRAGFHTVRPDSNVFLEYWMPFDASNQAIEEEENFQVDAKNGRFGDWKGAPADWSIYHPSLYDWRQKGDCNRVIARCLNLRTRFRNITSHEIRVAFEKAHKTKENVYLGITNHDFREMSVEIEAFYKDLVNLSQAYPGVKYKFSTAVEAFRSVLGFVENECHECMLKMECRILDNILHVEVVNGEPFGPQPYLAIKTKAGQYLHDNFDFGEFKKNYFYTFDSLTVSLEDVDQIGIASNDKYGNSLVYLLSAKSGFKACEYLNGYSLFF